MFPELDLVILETSHNQWPSCVIKSTVKSCTPMFLTVPLLKSLVQVISHFDEFLYAWTLITPTKLFSEITCISYAPDWKYVGWMLQETEYC